MTASALGMTAAALGMTGPHIRGMVRVISVFLLLAAIACETSTAPLPDGAVEFNAPAVYPRWWALTQECSGLTGDLSAVHWYLVPNADLLHLKDGRSVNGNW